LRTLKLAAESWPVAGSFRISRSSLTEIVVVTAKITEGPYHGVAECRPYARYNEDAHSVIRKIETIRTEIENGSANLDTLASLLPAGAARNAIDCALWNLRANQTGRSIGDMLNLPAPTPRKTAFTLSIDTPENMFESARAAGAHQLLKIKIAGLDGLQSCEAALAARPDAELIIDANEALSPQDLMTLRYRTAHLPVIMIEQPLHNDIFDHIPNAPDALPIICADESLHSRKDLKKLWSAGYRAVNVKLDKCGGVSETFHVMKEARNMGFIVMAGCMVGTSLAMRPILALESLADYIDLDGPLLLARDREQALRYEGSRIFPD